LVDAFENLAVMTLSVLWKGLAVELACNWKNQGFVLCCAPASLSKSEYYMESCAAV